LSIAALVVCGGVVFNLSSCGRDQQLVSIQIQPSTETFGDANTPVAADAGLQVQLRALGTFIHPPVTKDITSQVTWSSNTPQMMTVDAAGLVTVTGQACGNTLISATVTTDTSSGGISSKGALVTAFMTGNVVCSNGTGGPSGASISLSFQGTGTGTVTSTPSGLSCASSAGSCAATFASGTDLTLTANPSGTFGGWSGGCDSTSGNGLQCVINNVTSRRAVTATFN
jgi:hypothetical protein